jgi:hypothetical protein
MKEPLSAEQQAQARELAAAITEAAQEEILQIASALTASGPASLFGETEFKVRDIILKVAAKAYEQHLAQKKMATKAPA